MTEWTNVQEIVVFATLDSLSRNRMDDKAFELMQILGQTTRPHPSNPRADAANAEVDEARARVKTEECLALVYEVRERAVAKGDPLLPKCLDALVELGIVGPQKQKLETETLEHDKGTWRPEDGVELVRQDHPPVPWAERDGIGDRKSGNNGRDSGIS